MTTSTLAGDRSRRARSPRDVTGREYARQQAELKAKQEAASIDISEVRRTEYLRGHTDGYAKGLDDGWDACVRALVAEGILAPDDDAEDPE